MTRPVRRWAATKSAANKALRDALRERTGTPQEMALGPHSRFREAADIWFTKIEERRADSITYYPVWPPVRAWIPELYRGPPPGSPRTGPVRFSGDEEPQVEATSGPGSRKAREVD